MFNLFFMNFRCVNDENQPEIDLKFIKIPTNQEEEEIEDLGKHNCYYDQKKNYNTNSRRLQIAFSSNYNRKSASDQLHH